MNMRVFLIGVLAVGYVTVGGLAADCFIRTTKNCCDLWPTAQPITCTSGSQQWTCNPDIIVNDEYQTLLAVDTGWNSQDFPVNPNTKKCEVKKAVCGFTYESCTVAGNSETTNCIDLDPVGGFPTCPDPNA